MLEFKLRNGNSSINNEIVKMNRLNRSIYSGVWVLAFCMITGNVHATFYKWVDEQGATNYSEWEPIGIEAEEISPPPGVDTESAIRDLEEQQKKITNLQNRRKVKADIDRIDEQNAKIKKKNCEMAKVSLASHDPARVYILDDDGNRVRATEEQRQGEIAKSKERVNKYCN